MKKNNKLEDVSQGPAHQNMDKVELSKLQKAFLVGVYFSTDDKPACEENLSELARLCDTFGLEVVGHLSCPVKKLSAGEYLGSGKLEEIRLLILELGADVIIFDDEISPNQQRNIEKLFNRAVIDRTELIIGVFAERAQTREAKLQIELAKARYQLPRLKRLWTHLSRQSASGGAFLKGEGEKQIEIDRRLLRRQIDKLKAEIEEIIQKRKTQRILRSRSEIPTFAIVGYTNAGKSTLLNALTDAGVLVEDKLFATLDTTTRQFELPNKQPILLIDTVGFIRKIPHMLIAAFKSTLEEAVYTDILIHLIDVSHPSAEQHAEETIKVLKSLGADKQPMITVLNKIDQCTSAMPVRKLRLRYPRAIEISALTGEGLDLLIHRMTEELSSLSKVVQLRIPQSHYALVSSLMRQGRVFSCEYEENDVLLKIEIPVHLERQVLPYLK